MEVIDISKIILNAFLFFVLLLFMIYFELVAKPFQHSGFYCSDFSVTMKYKSSTIDTSFLILLSTLAPFVLILLSEIAIRTQFNLSNRIQLSSFHFTLQSINVRLLNNKLIKIKEFLANIYINYGYYLTGLVLTTIVVLIGKKTVGRLRPNFLDVCKPDHNPYSKCNTFEEVYLVPGVNFRCTSEDESEVQESKLSFPSGHAATAFYTVVFLIFFLNKLFNRFMFGIFLLILQIGLFSFAFFVSLTRISDHKHHPTDVIAGATIGSLIGFATFYHLNEFYKRNAKMNMNNKSTSYSQMNSNQFAEPLLISNSSASNGVLLNDIDTSASSNRFL